MDEELVKEFEKSVQADYDLLGEETKKELPFAVFQSIEFSKALGQWMKKQEQLNPKSIKPILDKQRRRAKKTLKKAGIPPTKEKVDEYLQFLDDLIFQEPEMQEIVSTYIEEVIREYLDQKKASNDR